MDKLMLCELSPHSLAIAVLAASLSGGAKAETPAAVAAPDAVMIARVHAEGAQIYECKADVQGRKTWQFREPIATLMRDGKTIGRHFAGPTWELTDHNNVIVAKVVGRAPGPTPQDIPLLKLEVSSRRGAGRLAAVTTVQRLDTRGGALEGDCSSPGALASVPYSANYTFLQRAD